MNRFKSLAAMGAVCLSLVMAVPTFAQTTPTTGTTPTVKPKHDVTCGKIIELASDHATLLKADYTSVRIKLGDTTRFTARSFAAATAGLKEGDYAAVAAGDGQGDGAAHAMVFAIENLCIPKKANRVQVVGLITDHTPTSLTVTDKNNHPIDFALTDKTVYYVNGKKVDQRPDFTNGEHARVVGVENPDNSYSALVVAVRFKTAAP